MALKDKAVDRALAGTVEDKAADSKADRTFHTQARKP